MAEPDNLEEDLFADLYADDEETKAPPPVTETKPEPAVVNGANETKDEDVAPEPPKQEEDTQMFNNDHNDNNNDEDDDDDIDFNLGGNSNDYSAPPAQDAHGPGIKEDGKMFIGGLNWETTDQSLRDYFSQFGDVLECTVMRDGASGRSRGFGFLTFKDAKTVNIVMVKEHYLDGKIIDPKRAIPRDEQERTSKIFVGGVSQDATEQDFKEFFMQFGRVIDATLMMDKDTGRPRGFGFVTFDSEAAVDHCLEGPLEILGKPIEVKKAQPRGNMREDEDGGGRGGRGGRGGFGKGGRGGFNGGGHGGDDGNGNGGGMPGMMGMGQGGMSGQMMAQQWQRMQQYIAMMQQQVMAGRGMNPAMMAQMAQMQQMQAMQAQMVAAQGQGARSQSPQSPNGGGPAAMAMGMGGMNPAMMQQMMAMQQAQAQAQGMGGNGFNGGGGPNAGGSASGQGGSNPGGRIGTPGYNAYEQQMFEQQKYEQQQARRAARDPATNYGGGGYGMGGPTSWEGMYDDVPQPNIGGVGGGGGGHGGRGGGHGGRQNRGSATPVSGPQSAPPANAPTGPKNAGKPGANYRGGGRGGNRGYHPYARG